MYAFSSGRVPCAAYLTPMSILCESTEVGVFLRHETLRQFMQVRYGRLLKPELGSTRHREDDVHDTRNETLRTCCSDARLINQNDPVYVRSRRAG